MKQKIFSALRLMLEGALRRPFCAELVVAATALIVRSAFLWEMRGSPVFRYTFGDGLVYETWARGIAAGDWLGTGVFYQAPLYPYFLALIHVIFGPGLVPVRIAQILLGTMSCVLLVRAGRSFFTPAIGLAAGLLLAVYPSAIFFDGLIQKSALDLPLMALLLAAMGGIHRNDRPRRWFGLGLVLGALLLTRENALVLLGAMLLWLAARQWAAPRAGGLTRALLLVAGCTLIVLPAGVRNRVVGGEFHLTTAQFGPNFYIGNNPTANGIYKPLRPGGGDARWERTDSTELAEKALGRRLSPREVSRYWTGQALDFISQNPGRWLILMWNKWLLFWNSGEISDTEDQESYGDWSPTLRVLNKLFTFGMLLPLAAVGICLSRSRWRELWILYATAILYACSVVLFYVFSRYRYPLVPLLVLFGGGGGAGLRRDQSPRLGRPVLGRGMGAPGRGRLRTSDSPQGRRHPARGAARQHRRRNLEYDSKGG